MPRESGGNSELMGKERMKSWVNVYYWYEHTHVKDLNTLVPWKYQSLPSGQTQSLLPVHVQMLTICAESIHNDVYSLKLLLP